MSVFAKLVRRPIAVVAGAATVVVLAQLGTGPATASAVLLAVVPADSYGAAVHADGASIYWRLDETSGGVVANDITATANSGSYSSGVVVGEPGSPAASTGTSFRFPGGSTQNVVSNSAAVNPTVFSVETWFKTTTTTGGRLIGFGTSSSSQTLSSQYDRHIYMLDNGKLRYGIYTGANSYFDSPLSYNDGQWHHVVATQGSGGGKLYVDGAQVASGSAVTPEVYTGYWRLGTDKVWGNSTSMHFAGTLDEAAVYPSVLSAATITNHYQIGIPPPNVAPTASFTATPENLQVAFNASASSDSDGTIASYVWDFGDGTSGTGAQPSHTYPAGGSYTAVLTVTDNRGATGLTSRVVAVAANESPAAAFSSQCTDLACTFDAAASTDPDGTITSYAWAFGDSTSGTGVNATHSYTSGGSYDVTLTVTDNDGARNTLTQSVTVAPPNNPPTALPVVTCTDLTCTFSGSGSTDSDGTIASYAWDFGDGATAATGTGQQVYTAAGTYQVALTVTDNRGATGTASVVVTVTAPNQSPTAAFTFSCSDLICSFNAADSGDPDGSVTGYRWAFGDGGSSTAVATTYTYPTGGTFSATLTVTDDDGATNAVTRSVTVVDPVLAVDQFERSVASGLGTADRGGDWTYAGTGTTAAVVDGSARLTVDTNRNALLRLPDVSNLNTELNTVAWSVGTPSGSGVYLGSNVRVTSTGIYRARVRLQASGTVTAQFVRAVGVTDTVIGGAAAVSGISYTSGMRLRVRTQALGSSPTTLRTKIWVDGTTEPTAWTLSVTDSTTGYQSAGSIGLWAFASSTSATSTVRFDDVSAVIVPAAG